MSNYLFLFTIGPVQSFIAQARKTQDLYAGSKLLSDLIGGAMSELRRLDDKVEIIFPDPSLSSKPNRFIAVVNNPERIGKELEIFIKSNFIETATKNSKKEFPDIDMVKLTSHLENFLEIYWNAIPINGDSYTREEYARLEKELGEIKTARVFNQWGIDSERYRKCSLCGERDAIVINAQKHSNFYYSNFVKNQNNYKLEQGEGLCGVCINKRIIKIKEGFPSTADIALLHTIHTLKNHAKDGLKTLQDYCALFNTHLENLDSQLFFEENLTDDYFIKHEINTNSSLDKIKSQLRKIDEFGKSKKINLQKYYAVLVFDGDSMGRWLSGDNEFVKPDIDFKKFHSDLSKCLGEFANVCSKYLDTPKGKAVYAGGDDFLGFVNLSYLFEVMNYFYNQFEEKVNDPLKKYFIQEKKMSFSVGIAIAHYKIPLSEVISSARVMEEEAKGIDNNKNAFAVEVLKHSGERQSFKLKLEDGMGNSNFEIIHSLIQVLKSEELSNTFIHSIVKEFEKLLYKGKEAKKNSSLNNLIETEINRLIERSYNLKENKKENVERLSKLVNGLYCNNSTNIFDPDNFFSVLTISDFIRKHMNTLSEGK